MSLGGFCKSLNYKDLWETPRVDWGLLVQNWCKGVAPESTPMARRNGNPSPRFRVGKVTVYEHHSAWWLYYRDAGQSHRRKVADDRDEAATVAARVNAQLVQQEPTLLTFSPITVAELRRQFLEYHETVLHSAVSTVSRYRAATQHLEDFAARDARPVQAHQVKP